MTLTRKRILALASILLIGTAISYAVWGGLEENLVYFVTPTEILSKGPRAVGNPVRLGGVVQKGSVRMEGTVLTFTMTDGKESVPVATTKAPPQMFQEGMGVVVEGAMRHDGKFDAERLMVKHGNEYRPPDLDP